MFRPRVIPVLLLKNQGLVKSVGFKNFTYIGDPMNAVRIYNDLKADELVFLDIEATKQNRLISLDFVREVGEEANMPFAVGGGIKTIDDIRKVTSAGAEKVVINTAAANVKFIENAAKQFGSSTIVVCIDVKKKLFG
jgi:cyclase